MERREELKSLKRGLRALIILSRRSTITIAEAAADLALPRTTAERILTTLEQERFVVRDARSKRYRLAPRVLALSQGFSEADSLIDAAGPLLVEKTKALGWPLAIAMAEGDQMVVRFTTDSVTSLGLHKRHVGSEIAMAASSSGLLHIAFLDGAEQEALIGTLAASDDPAQALARNRPLLDSYLNDARKDGFALSPDYGAERALSVPIFHDGRMIAALLFMYIARGIGRERLLSQYLPEMRQLSEAIEQAAFGQSADP